MSPVRPTVLVVGQSLEAEHHRLRDFLTRTAQPYEFLELGSPEAAALLAQHGLAARDLPVVVDGSDVFRNATVALLAEAWNLSTPPSRKHYDLAIVGAGPAGLAAAVYAASDGLSTVVIEADVPGGQASHTSMIENFFGFPDGIGGAELARLAGRQAERFGAELILLRGVVGSTPGAAGAPSLLIDGGYEVTADAVIAANGMEWRRLEVEGMAELLGRGVYYGAGRSEAARFGGDHVIVIGAGNSAGQAVLDFAGAGARVTMIVRGDQLGSNDVRLPRRANRADTRSIDVRLHSSVDGSGSRRRPARCGDDLRRRRQDRSSCTARALFLCIGGTPRTAWAAGAGVRVNPAGFVLTGSALLEAGRRPEGWPLDRDPLVLETTIPGLFAAGDLRSGSTKRVAGAVGEGAMAAALAHRRLEELAAETLTREPHEHLDPAVLPVVCPLPSRHWTRSSSMSGCSPRNSTQAVLTHG